MDQNVENSAPKVAVIVPVYNVERFLPECLDSLLAQTLREIEIICVNDVSPDNSAAILAEYSQKDARVKVITHEVNQGLGPARNSGVAFTKAPYIAFVDSDDYVKPEMMETLFNAIEEQKADLAWCGMAKVTEAGVLVEGGTIPAEVLTPEQALSDIRFYPSLQVVCNKLYKREILKDIKQLRILIEDEPTNAQYFSRIKKIISIELPLTAFQIPRIIR
jgi:glycosyltransferase involved in cell wall biosynthesis